MKIQSVHHDSFRQYGKVLEGYDTSDLLVQLAATPCPSDQVVYVASVEAFEQLPVARTLADHFYGGMPIQLGYCSGHNKTLNCLEYHRGSEVNIFERDAVLLLAPLWKMENGCLHTDAVEAFLAPAGSAVQLFETSLHYAPCTAPGGSGFRTVIVLPRDTNTDKPEITPTTQEDALLWGRNKWLSAHPQSPEAGVGAFVGLSGPNVVVE